MSTVKNHSFLFVMGISILGVATLIGATTVVKHTTITKPAFNNERLVGNYLEQDKNHKPLSDAETINIQTVPIHEGASNILVLTFTPRDKNETLSIVFESLTISNAFTSKKDSFYGFNEVLRPIKVFHNLNAEDLVKIKSVITSESDFPEKCMFKAFNHTIGPNLGKGWASSKNVEVRKCRYFSKEVSPDVESLSIQS